MAHGAHTSQDTSTSNREETILSAENINDDDLELLPEIMEGLRRDDFSTAMGKSDNGNDDAHTQQDPQAKQFLSTQPQKCIQKRSVPKFSGHAKHEEDECPSPQKRRRLGHAHPSTECNTKAISIKDNRFPMQEKSGGKSRSKNSHAAFSVEYKVQSTQEKSRIKRINLPFSLKQKTQVIESRYTQCVDCKMKNVSTTSRHENLASNIKSTVSHVEMKWYRLLQIAVCDNGRRQLQTPCLCGKVRTFTQRRAVRKGVAITYFATNACSCGHKQTDKLLMCSCGALFRTTASLYACPCFGGLGPAFEEFPSYSEFAPRPCACPPHSIKRRCCSCMS